jgi:hypothetical protein
MHWLCVRAQNTQAMLPATGGSGVVKGQSNPALLLGAILGVAALTGGGTEETVTGCGGQLAQLQAFALVHNRPVCLLCHTTTGNVPAALYVLCVGCTVV